MEVTIFREYYGSFELEDRFLSDTENAIDVIIPVLNTNDLWKTNLHSFYKEIPINRLLIGDGGCTDDTLDIVREFPRVEVVSLKDTSLGFRIRKLIELVETTFFIYLHSDVYLPSNWYDDMEKYKDKYDWFECKRRMTVLIDFWSHDPKDQKRALSGSQFGRTDIMKKVSSKIEDDYSYRQEDIIFAELLEQEGGKYHIVEDTFHFHQTMNKVGAEVPMYKSINVEREADRDTEIMIFDTQVRGLIKYLKPKKYLITMANYCLFQLYQRDAMDWSEFRRWVKETNPVWLKFIREKGTWKQRFAIFAKDTYKKWK
ncbi:MAG: hypothetical protein ABJG78_07545 [Cyclobacteriaceae bacterium]